MRRNLEVLDARIAISIVALLLFAPSASTGEPKHCVAAAFEDRNPLKLAYNLRQCLDWAFDAAVEPAAYGRLLTSFSAGEIDEDAFEQLPGWNAFYKRKLLKRELAFQAQLVQYLLENGLDSQERLLRVAVDGLVRYEELARAPYGQEKAIFEALKNNRKTFIRLRGKIR